MTLDEIYKIYMLLHRSDLNISKHFRQTFSHCSANFRKLIHFRKKQIIEFYSEFNEILSEFHNIFENVEKSDLKS